MRHFIALINQFHNVSYVSGTHYEESHSVIGQIYFCAEYGILPPLISNTPKRSSVFSVLISDPLRFRHVWAAWISNSHHPQGCAEPWRPELHSRAVQAALSAALHDELWVCTPWIPITCTPTVVLCTVHLNMFCLLRVCLLNSLILSEINIPEMKLLW